MFGPGKTAVFRVFRSCQVQGIIFLMVSLLKEFFGYSFYVFCWSKTNDPDSCWPGLIPSLFRDFSIDASLITLSAYQIEAERVSAN